MVGDASVWCTSVIAMLPFILAWLLLRVAKCLVYSYSRQDTVYELMDFN